MGLPEIKISFKEITKRLQTRAGRGIVAVVLKDTKNLGITEIKSEKDIPTELTRANKKLVSSVFLGNTQDRNEGGVLTEVTYKPSSVVLCVVNTSGETIDNAFNLLENKEFNILCYPDAIESDNTKIISFVEKMRENGVDVMAVISSATPPDKEYIINWQTDNVEVDGEKVLKAKYCARIAGLIAGTPYAQSVTYAILNDITTIPDITNVNANAAVNEGKLIAINTAGAVRIARGVTSLTTTDNQVKGKSFKKIKIVQTYDFINNSVRKVIVENYIGKVPNSYSNKCLLMNEIKLFLDELVKEGLLKENPVVEINMEKQKEYLKSIGVKVDDMKESEIREADTDSYVFITMKVEAIDAMEDFDIAVEV